MESFETWRKNMRVMQPSAYLNYTHEGYLGRLVINSEYKCSHEATLNILEALDFYRDFFNETQKHLDIVQMKKAQKKRYNDAYRSKHGG